MKLPSVASAGAGQHLPTTQKLGLVHPLYKHLYNAATDIYGGFQDWGWQPSLTTADGPEPAFYGAGATYGGYGDGGCEMTSSTTADEPEPYLYQDNVIYVDHEDEGSVFNIKYC